MTKIFIFTAVQSSVQKNRNLIVIRPSGLERPSAYGMRLGSAVGYVCVIYDIIYCCNIFLPGDVATYLCVLHQVYILCTIKYNRIC